MKKKTPIQVLHEARALISKPERWTQGQTAVQRDGTYVNIHDPSAVAWCAVGAVYRCSIRDDEVAGKVRDKLRQSISVSRPSLTYFNDTHTHAEVLALFDRAILAEIAK